MAVEEGWITPEAVPDGEERDHFDDRALHVVGRDRDVVVARARLVLPQPGRPLPTEEVYVCRSSSTPSPPPTRSPSTWAAIPQTGEPR